MVRAAVTAAAHDDDDDDDDDADDEDAEEELYFASPPFMPPNPRESQLGDGDEEPPPRPPETVFVQIVKAYLKDDLLIRARRFKTAGSTQAKFRSQLRTAPHGLWLSSKSLTAGV
ncbi:hypothetical protein Vretifemale_17872 [Volvox reticuliferus]|uniref:Uncharacterized protein n=1 Tax=Volvox reticuliferus TaxID=1737510 RepID=A0A8J4FV11_9CHLO|nr:hypothetical protein Vretifemale_17872 [Volvox reticuliferus]